tara:strand:- start:3574 stop:4764 length:1191 start_codon:yes stop_codon:yes gene_type:complete
MAISLKKVTKSYRLDNHNSFGGQFTGLLRPKWKQVIKETNLDIGRGESISIIGRNGSGKSTLLKLICDITKPTTGSVEVDGRVCALLELGSGFNNSFTGKENVRLTCSIYGIDQTHFEKIYNKIEKYAGIDEYINFPVYTYSSGMRLRLAFAIFANLEPDILIIDEALSVGDMFFRKKCFKTISEHIERGKTLVFTSHSEDQLRCFSDRTIVLENGELIYDGKLNKGIELYHNLNFKNRSDYYDKLEKKFKNKEKNTTKSLTTQSFNIFGSDGNSRNLFSYGEEINLEYSFKVDKNEKIYTGILIRNKEGFNIYSTEIKVICTKSCVYKPSFKFRNKLGRNSYFVEIYFVSRTKNTSKILEWIYDAIIFNVEYALPHVKTRFKGGVVDLNAKSVVK